MLESDCKGPRFDVACILASLRWTTGGTMELAEATRLLKTEHHRWMGTTTAYMNDAAELCGLMIGLGWKPPAPASPNALEKVSTDG